MEHLLTYLLKSSLVIGLFYCCYQMFLRNETFFKAKRWFLVSGISIALVFPLLIIKQFIETPMLQIGEKVAPTNNSIESVAVSSNPTDWWFILSAIYVAGCMFFLVQFLIQLFSLYRLIKKGKYQKANSFTMVEIEEDVSPFSFFNFIVFNPNKHSSEDLQTILVHEKAHSTQKHSIDMILAHLLCIFQWANPFAWGYKKAITENLEYIADDTTTRSLSNKKEYQYLLLGENIVPNTSITITNTFINSLIKKRIVMLNKKKSHKRNLLKMGIVLPLLTIAMFMVNTETVAQIKTENNKPYSTFRSEIHSESTIESLNTTINAAKEFNVDLKFDNLKRNNKEEIIAISSSFSSPDGHSGNISFKGEKPTGTFYFYVSKDKLGKILKIGFTTNIETTQIAEGIQTLNKKNNSKNGYTNIKKKYNLTAHGEKPLIIVDGKTMPQSDTLSNLKPNMIESIRVLKNTSATNKYGEKAKNGAIEITLKK